MHVFNLGVWGVGREVFQNQGMLLEQQPCSHLHDVLLDGSKELALLLLERGLCHWCRCRGVFRGKILGSAHGNSPCEAPEVPCLQGTLDWPQNDAEEDDDQGREEDYALPVITHVTAGQPPS